MTTRAKRFLEEALVLIGEAEDSKDLFTDDKDASGEKDPTVIDDTAGDSLDLGAEPEEPPVEDDFGLGGSNTPSVRIQKDGPITVNKGDVQLMIGDDGNIDITFDGGASAIEPDLGDMTDKAPAPEEESPEEDDYKIDWEKEKESEPKESLEEDLEGQVLSAGSRRQGVDGSVAPNMSKARLVLSMDNSTSVVAECKDKKYECMSCECYDECVDKNKKQETEDEADFLTQSYK